MDPVPYGIQPYHSSYLFLSGECDTLYLTSYWGSLYGCDLLSFQTFNSSFSSDRQFPFFDPFPYVMHPLDLFSWNCMRDASYSWSIDYFQIVCYLMSDAAKQTNNSKYGSIALYIDVTHSVAAAQLLQVQMQPTYTILAYCVSWHSKTTTHWHAMSLNIVKPQHTGTLCLLT